MATKSIEFEELNQAMDEIMEDLVCRICQDFPRPWQPRWYKCSENHQICQYCVEVKLYGKCQCEGKISKKADKMTEAILKLNTTKFKCRHCREKCTKETLQSHESECNQRLVPCPADGCREMVILELIWHHYEWEHWIILNKVKVTLILNTINGLSYNLTLPPSWNKSRLDFPRNAIKFEAYGKVFLSSVVTINGVLHEWVQLIGSRSDAEEYVFSLEYKGPKNTNFFLGEVSAIDDTVEEIVTSGKSATIGFESFKAQFIEGDPCKFSWTTTVKKLEETQSD